MDLEHVKFPDGRFHRFDTLEDALWALWEATGNDGYESMIKWTVVPNVNCEVIAIDENGHEYDIEPINRIKPSQY